MTNVQNLFTDPTDYRARAQEAIDLASITEFPAMRSNLLNLAAAWWELADQVEIPKALVSGRRT
jgi:hypothetical protein